MPGDRVERKFSQRINSPSGPDEDTRNYGKYSRKLQKGRRAQHNELDLQDGIL